MARNTTKAHRASGQFKIAPAAAMLACLAVIAIADTPADSLRRIEAEISQGRAGQAVAEIDAGLRGWSSTELPIAFMARGKARMALARQATTPEDQKKLYVQAGVDFMRVAVLFPYSPQAPDALLLAGQSCASAGNSAGATAIYQTLTSKYPDSQAARQAKETQK